MKLEQRKYYYFWGYPCYEWKEAVPSGRWKIKRINDDSTLYIECVIEKKKWFRKYTEYTWVSEYALREVEETINECST